jgi:hypothetical protein
MLQHERLPRAAADVSPRAARERARRQGSAPVWRSFCGFFFFGGGKQLVGHDRHAPIKIAPEEHSPRS